MEFRMAPCHSCGPREETLDLRNAHSTRIDWRQDAGGRRHSMAHQSLSLRRFRFTACIPGMEPATLTQFPYAVELWNVRVSAMSLAYRNRALPDTAGESYVADSSVAVADRNGRFAGR